MSQATPALLPKPMVSPLQLGVAKTGYFSKAASPSLFPESSIPPILASVPLELIWRRSIWPGEAVVLSSRPLVSRWADLRTAPRESTIETESDHHTITLALRDTHLALESNGRRIHDGNVIMGMAQICGPGVLVRAIFRAPCDFLHLRIANGFLEEFHEKASQCARPCGLPAVDAGFRRDTAVEQLTRALLAAQSVAANFDNLYIDGIATAIVTRLFSIGPQRAVAMQRLPILALAKWRLNRVIEFIEAQLEEPIRLTDLATAAGLSRMHFAAQFRMATGLRPHEYLLRRRIERAKTLLGSTNTSLVDVALAVGFQTQAHFSSVFRRFAGETPGRWRELTGPVCLPHPLPRTAG